MPICLAAALRVVEAPAFSSFSVVVKLETFLTGYSTPQLTENTFRPEIFETEPLCLVCGTHRTGM